MVKIVIDPGHEGVGNGLDPGAVANGLKEAELTLKIAKHIYDMLSEYEGVQLKMTRTGNQSLTLSQRAKMANDWGADFFLSIHVNAGGGTGFESYIYNGNVSNATVAYQNVIHAEVLKAIGNVRDRGKKRANYAVLRETKMPAVLTENLFIDSDDAKLLKNEAFLKAVGEAHARGVAKFLGLPKKAKPTPSQPQQKEEKEVNKDDVKGHWAEASIKRAMEKGIIVGHSDGTFKPDEPVTRAQLAVILDRLGLLK